MTKVLTSLALAKVEVAEDGAVTAKGQQILLNRAFR